jgi:hypothetical protein
VAVALEDDVADADLLAFLDAVVTVFRPVLSSVPSSALTVASR